MQLEKQKSVESVSHKIGIEQAKKKEEAFDPTKNHLMEKLDVN